MLNLEGLLLLRVGFLVGEDLLRRQGRFQTVHVADDFFLLVELERDPLDGQGRAPGLLHEFFDGFDMGRHLLFLFFQLFAHGIDGGLEFQHAGDGMFDVCVGKAHGW